MLRSCDEVGAVLDGSELPNVNAGVDGGIEGAVASLSLGIAGVGVVEVPKAGTGAESDFPEEPVPNVKGFAFAFNELVLGLSRPLVVNPVDPFPFDELPNVKDDEDGVLDS